MPTRFAVLVLALVAFVACGGDKKSKPAPTEKPFTGAPVLVEVTKINDDSLDVDVYNFADKPIVAYWFLIRYKDGDGKVMKVQPGTPFEADSDHMTMSGNAYKVNPKSWKSLEIEMLEIPAGAKTAEVIVKSVSAPTADGTMVEEDALWELDGFEWPAGGPAK